MRATVTSAATKDVAGRSPAVRDGPAPAGADEEHLNEVRLVGRISAAPTGIELPSGDTLSTFRVSVRRPPVPARRGAAAVAVRRRAPVDAIDCAAWRAGVQRTVSAFAVGDLVEVRGSLRRQFRRTGGVPTSRYEIEVTAVRRVAKAG
jgi:single-strand DNA-binding protein